MTSKEKLILGIPFSLALLFRILVLTHTSVTFFSDDAIYAEIARFWIQGKWGLVFHPTWQPLYSFFGACFYLLVGNWENAMRLVSAVSGALLILPLYFCARKLLSDISLFVFLITISFFTPILNRSLLPMSDMLFTFLLVSAFVFIFYVFVTRRKRFVALSAFSFGIAYLTRSEGFVFAFLSLVFLFFFLALKRTGFKKIVSSILVFIITFVVVCSPYMISTRIQLGKWTFSQKGTAQIKQGHAFQVRENGQTWSQEVVSIKSPNYKSSYYSGGLKHILEYSDWYWWWFSEKLGKWKNSVGLIFPSWAILIIILGVVFSLKSNYRWFFLYFIFLFVVITPLTIFATPLVDIRYLLWAFPFLILFIYMFFAKFGKFSLLAIFATAILPSFSFYPLLSFNSYISEYTRQYSWSELAIAGDWLRTQEIKDPRIMMKHEGVEFYADGYTVYTPQEFTLDQIIKYAKRLNTDYIVAWTNELAGDKNLSVLLSGMFTSKELEKVYVNMVDSREIIIYKIVD